MKPTPLILAELRELPAFVPVITYAAAIGVSSDVIYDLISRGELNALHVSRRILLPTAPLIRVADANPSEEASSSEDARADG
ncbi:MAG: hypothetical protein ACLQUT_00560 [Thermoleophilia bacterium]